MAETFKHCYTGVSVEELKPYLRAVRPPLDVNKLQFELLEGDERDGLKTHYTGDASMVLKYKDKEGFLASLGYGPDLEVLQLQGAKGSQSEGFRVNTGLQVVKLYARQIELFAKESGSDRIIMPRGVDIAGVNELTQETGRERQGLNGELSERYKELASWLRMDYSDEENCYVRDVKGLERSGVIFSRHGK